jgi:hypothetical protein
MRHILRSFLPLLWICVCSVGATAATWYVAPSGSDSNPGTSAAPFATIQKAADVASAGDTVIVRPGTYAGARFTRSGRVDAHITFRGEPGARPAGQKLSQTPLGN